MKPSASGDQVVARNFMLLGAGEILARVLVFLSMIWVGRVLGAEGYGVVGFASAVLLYFVRLADFGIEALGPRDIASDEGFLVRVAPSLLAVRALVSLLLTAALALAGTFVLEQPDGHALALYGLTLLAVGASTRWIHIGLEQAHRVALARVLGELLRVALVLLLVRDPGDLLLVPVAQVVGDFLTAGVLLVWLRHHERAAFRLHLDWDLARPVFHRAAPLVLTTLLGLVIYNSDLLFLRVLHDTGEVGLYLAAFTLITFLANLGANYNASLLPTLTRERKRGEEEQRELFLTAQAQVAAATLPIAAGGFLVATGVMGVSFGEQFGAAGPVLQILVLSVPFLLLRGVLQQGLIVHDQQRLILRSTVAAVILNLALNATLIPTLGMTGAAVSTLATEVARWGLVLVFVRSVRFPLLGPRRVWRAALATAVMVAALRAMEDPAVWSAVPLGAAVYAACLTLTGGIRLRGRRPTLSV